MSPASAPPSGFETIAPAIGPCAATSNTWARSSVATTAPMSSRMSIAWRVSVSRRRPDDDAPPDREHDGDEHDDRDDVLHRRDRHPQGAVERDLEDRLDEAAGDDVRRADREQDEAPEDREVHDARGQVTEHPRLHQAVADGPREPRQRPVRRRCVPGGREHPQVAGHREGEEDRRAPEDREHQRVERDLGEGLEHLPLLRLSWREVEAAAALAAAWSNGPRSVSSAWSSSGTTTSNDSRAPFGDPGRFTISEPPRTPTTPRERAANGVDSRPSARIASAMPGTS